MIKLLITAITWVMVSSGLIGVPTWLISTDTKAERTAKVAADAYCNRGNWPDRDRACGQAKRIPSLSPIAQPAETTSDLAKVEARIAGPLAFNGGVRFYDASGEAGAPVTVEAPAYELSGTTVTLPKAEKRVAAAPQPAYSVDERLPEQLSTVARPRQTSAYRPAPVRKTVARETPRRLAASQPGMRIYGVAF